MIGFGTSPPLLRRRYKPTMDGSSSCKNHPLHPTDTRASSGVVECSGWDEVVHERGGRRRGGVGRIRRGRRSLALEPSGREAAGPCVERELAVAGSISRAELERRGERSSWYEAMRRWTRHWTGTGVAESAVQAGGSSSDRADIDAEVFAASRHVQSAELETESSALREVLLVAGAVVVAVVEAHAPMER